MSDNACSRQPRNAGGILPEANHWFHMFMHQPVLRPNPWIEAAFLIFGLAANVTNWRIMRDVNARLASDQKFSWWWWTFAQHTRLLRRHREIYPDSQWRLYFVASF